MGLAASQARFLAITSRKMNCEFQSMQIAQQKLSVTRDLQKAAQDYQDSLSATKLVWNSQDDDIYSLSYDTMMTPSVLNDYDAYLLTDTQGKIVLNDKMYKAAVDSGVIDSKGNPSNVFSEECRNKFLDALGAVGAVDMSNVKTIKSLGAKGYTLAGVGAPIYDKTSANAMPTNTFLNYLKTVTYGDLDTNILQAKKGGTLTYNTLLLEKDDTGASKVLVPYVEVPSDINYVTYSVKKGESMPVDYKGKYKGDLEDVVEGGTVTKIEGTENPKIATLNLSKGDQAPFDMIFNVQTSKEPHKASDLVYSISLYDLLGESESTNVIHNTTAEWKGDREGNNFYVVVNNNSAMSDESLKNVSIGDILTGKYSLMYKGDGTKDGDEFKEAATKILTAIATALGFGASSSDFIGLNVDAESDLALDQAYAMTLLQLNKTYKYDMHQFGSVLDQTKRNNMIVNGTKDKGQYYGISLSNLAKSFLTNFAIAIDGYGRDLYVDTDYTTTESTKRSKFVTDDPTCYFITQNHEAITDKDYLMADFYNQLYNQLALNGACTDAEKRARITDDKYLDHALKNGQLFISQLNTDGFFYQGAYTSGDHVSEVTDEEAIARAEAEYNVTKSKLNYKEETLELKMKNIDTELSALSTEYDTVKNMISKSVEKVFTMFST